MKPSPPAWTCALTQALPAPCSTPPPSPLLSCPSPLLTCSILLPLLVIKSTYADVGIPDGGVLAALGDELGERREEALDARAGERAELPREQGCARGSAGGSQRRRARRSAPVEAATRAARSGRDTYVSRCACRWTRRGRPVRAEDGGRGVSRDSMARWRAAC